jgi:hypothetical protein
LSSDAIKRDTEKSKEILSVWHQDQVKTVPIIFFAIEIVPVKLYNATA